MKAERAIAFGGRTLRQRSVGGFEIAEAVYTPGLRVPRHAHEKAYMGFVLAGACRETGPGASADLEPLWHVVREPGECHENAAGPGGTRFLLVEGGDEIELWSRVGHARERRGALPAALALRLSEELRQVDDASSLSLEALVLELVSELQCRSAEERSISEPPWLRRARELLCDSHRESFSIGGVARVLGVDPTHFARRFRRHTGLTPGDYLRRSRLERALDRLGRSRERLADVALSAGYCDHGHMTRAIRRATGLTPSAFRAAARGEELAIPSKPGGAVGP